MEENYQIKNDGLLNYEMDKVVTKLPENIYTSDNFDNDITFVNEIEESIENSFFDKNSIQLGYALTNIESIRNHTIENTFT